MSERRPALLVLLLLALVAVAVAWSEDDSTSKPHRRHTSSDSKSEISSHSRQSLNDRRAARARRQQSSKTIREFSGSRAQAWVVVGSSPPKFAVAVDLTTGEASTLPGAELYHSWYDLDFSDLEGVEAMACDAWGPFVIGREAANSTQNRQSNETLGLYVKHYLNTDNGRIRFTARPLFAVGGNDSRITGASFGGRGGRDKQNLYVWQFGADDESKNGLIEFDEELGPRYIGEGPHLGAFDDVRDNFPDLFEFERGIFDNGLAFSKENYLYHSNEDTLRIISTANGLRSTTGPKLVYDFDAFRSHPSCEKRPGPDDAATTTSVSSSSVSEDSVSSESSTSSSSSSSSSSSAGNNGQPVFPKYVYPKGGFQFPNVPPPPNGGKVLVEEPYVPYHDFRPTLSDLSFDQTTGKLFGIVVTYGNPLNFECNDAETPYWFLAEINVFTGFVHIIRILPTRSSGLAICTLVDMDEVRERIEDKILESSAPEIKGTESSYTTSTFINFVDFRLKEELAARFKGQCGIDLRLEGSSAGSDFVVREEPETTRDVLTEGDYFFTNETVGVDEVVPVMLKYNGTRADDTDYYEETTSFVDDSSEWKDTDVTSDLTDSNKQVRLAMVDTLKKHFVWFTYEIFVDPANASNIGAIDDCEYVRSLIAAALNITDVTEIVIIGRDRRFDEPLLVRNTTILENGDEGSNRVEFILTSCSKSNVKTAAWCDAVQLCGDEPKRIEEQPAGHAVGNWNDDAFSFPLEKPDDVNACIVSSL